MFRIEGCLLLLAVIVGLTTPTIGARAFRVCEDGFRRLAEKRRLAVLVVGLGAVAVRISLLGILPEPDLVAGDEYSYLLAADTFAHGRVTNPPHPMWIHFEPFHEIGRPTYASMYPPAQGLVLALGKVAVGHAFAGVLVSLGLMCAAICWMLQGWFSPGWAFLGALLVMIRFCTFSYWANSYWGGALAAAGGALVVGALPRIKQRQGAGAALLLGVGLALLANTRPYEGLVFSLPVAAGLLIWLLSSPRPPLAAAFRRVVAPLTLVLVVAGCAMAYYFWRVTGNPFLMPQELNRQTYAVAPYFLWQSPRPVPIYHHEVVQSLYLQRELPRYLATRTASGLAVEWGVRATGLWMFFLGPLFTFPLLMAFATLPHGFGWRNVSRSTRFLLYASAVSIIGLAAEVFAAPHYAAPTTCLIIALVLDSMRRLRHWRWRGKPTGLFLVRAVPLIGMAMLVLRLGAVPLHLPLPPPTSFTWCTPSKPDYGRARLGRLLTTYPGRHLVLVRYKPGHDVGLEWVYNDADIDASKVVWARDMGAAQNRELLDYFRGRRAWWLEADDHPPRLIPYESDVPPSEGVRFEKALGHPGNQ